MPAVKILFVGDVMGSPGRRAAGSLLGVLRSRFDVDFVLLNGENAAGGLGLTKPTSATLFDVGADVITLGNHAFAKRDLLEHIKQEPRIIRPANYPPGAPGAGWGVFETASGVSVAVLNLLGRTFIEPALDCPFRAADAALAEISDRAKVIIVDVHAEATSEKIAIAYYLHGRVSAVIGTHTHVQTSDEKVLSRGTAYLTDAGMTGVTDSVLGLDPAVVIQRFITRLPGQFVLATGKAALQGALIEIDAETGRAIDISRINVNEGDFA